MTVTMFFLLLPDMGAAAIITGDGTAEVTQATDASPDKIWGVVGVDGAYAGKVTGKDGQAVIRLQFIRPDSKAVAYAVWTVPSDYSGGTFELGTSDVKLLYYEMRPGSSTTKLFVADESSGSLSVDGPPRLDGPEPSAWFDFAVRDYGNDGIPDTSDDEYRVIEGGDVLFFARGDLSGVNYYYDEYDTVYTSGDAVIVYGEGCAGSPDSYDDDYDYDSEDYDDSYSGDSCDGDVYDDSYDDYDSSSSDYSGSSCDGDTDSSDDDYWDDSSDDGSWSDSGSDDSWDWDGDEYEEAAAALKVMSWTAGFGRHLLSRYRRPLRMLPMFFGLLLVVLLRIRTRKHGNRLEITR
jgi:hypothetical protein